MARDLQKHTFHPTSAAGISLFAAAVLIVVIVLIIFSSPQRSVVAYCKLHHTEKARLGALPGDTYPSGVFNEAVSDAAEFARSYSRLERVAPDAVRADIEGLQKIYERMDADPSRALSAALAAIGPDDAVKKWTAAHCKK